MVGSSLKSHTTLPSSVFPWLPSAATRPLGKPVSRANQGRKKKIPLPNDVDGQDRPETQARECRSRCDFYWPPLLPRSTCPSSSLFFITRVMNNSISSHFCSDWRMRETIVSGVSCAPTARSTASLPRSTWHRQRVCALHAPGKSRLDRAFYPARWRTQGLDGVSISRIGHHAISSAISSANKSIGGTLARTSTALIDTVWYAELILSTTPPLCREQFLLDSMVLKGTCPVRSCVKQFRIYHARHQLFLSFPGTTNPRRRWCSFQQVGPCAGNCHTWRSKRVNLPTTLKGDHMLSLLWETIFRPRISPTCRSDSYLSFTTGSLETFSTPSPQCRCSTSWYWMDCVCQCLSESRIRFARDRSPWPRESDAVVESTPPEASSLHPIDK